MKLFARATVVACATTLALAACQKPAPKPANDAAKAETGKAKYPGLPTDKDQAGYMIGMTMGKQLAEVKDDINVDSLVKAMRASLAGEKLLLTDEQAREISEAFGQRMQAKMIAKSMAEAKDNLDKGDKFLAENGKKAGVVTTPSGLQYQVLTEGKGAKPAATDGVKVHYKGTLLDGKTFDSSYDRGEPAVMPLQGVIPGWVEGIQLMPVGSKYKFWIPSKLAYGEQNPPGIGPNQTLVFEVELLDIVKPNAGK